MLEETGIATRAQEMHVAAALRDKGYTAFFSSWLAETGATSTSRGGGLLTAVSSKYVAEHEVLSFTEIVPGKAAALEIRTDGGGLTLINVHGPQAGCSPWAGRAAFWADIQTYARARSLGGRHPVVIAGDTNIYMDATTNPATEHFQAGWEACCFRRARAGGEEDMTPTLHPSRHRVDTFLVNEPLLPWSLQESVWARGMAHPQVVGSHHLPVRLALPGLLSAAGRAAMPTPYSNTEGRLLPYDAEAAPVQHCLRAAVTAAQDEPSLAPWLGPAEQHDYGSMPAAAVDKVFEHLHATHDALARVVGRRQPSLAGTDPAEGDLPESGKRLQAAVLRYDTLAACAPAAYQADAARHGIRSEAALWLTEELRGVSPGFHPTTQGQLQEELERQAAALEEDIRQLRALLAADRKRATKDFWRPHAPDIAQRWKAVRGAIEVEAPGPSGPWNMRVPNTQTLLTEAHDVMFAVRAFWRELYDKRPVDLPGFQGVLGRHVPRVPEGDWTQVQQYSMQDLKSALDKADCKAPGTNHVEARFIKALPAPVQWLLVHSYRAILRGAPPPMHWRDAHICLSPKVPGSARLDDYRPIALGQLDMKLLTGPLTQRITEVLTRPGVVSDWQQGALPGSNTGPPLFMAQRQLQRGRPNYVFSFDARKAFNTAPHGALHLILRHLSLPPDVIDLTATGVPHDLHMAVHALEDQLEDTRHLVVHQRGGPAWLKEHMTALRSWAGTISGAEIRLHDDPAGSPGDTRALSVDQLTPRHPDVRWHSADLNAGWLSPAGYYWIPKAWGHTSSDGSGGGPCKHATSVALAADLTRTWAVAISGTVPNEGGVAASLPLQYGAHRPWVHTVDAEVILHLLRHADRERTTGVPAGAAKVVNQMPLRWLRDGLCA